MNTKSFGSQSKWISLLHGEDTQASRYYKTFSDNKFTRSKIRDYNIHIWPLNIYVPDMVSLMSLRN
jgi:hypothetical protein